MGALEPATNAASSLDVTAVQEALHAGADPDEECNRRKPGSHPLVQVFEWGCHFDREAALHVGRLLLESGANPDIAGRGSWWNDNMSIVDQCIGAAGLTLEQAQIRAEDGSEQEAIEVF